MINSTKSRSKLILLISLVVLVFFYITYAIAGQLSIFDVNAASGKKDTGAQFGYLQYGEEVGKETTNFERSTLKIEGILRDELQTKISFIINNIDISEFNPEVTLKDDIGNVYKDVYISAKFDETNKTLSGVIELQPVNIQSKNLKLTLQDRKTNQVWEVQFEVDPEKYGLNAMRTPLNISIDQGVDKVTLLEAISSPSMTKFYLETSILINYIVIKDTEENEVSNMLRGFAPANKTGDWSHEFIFNPVPNGQDLIFEINTDNGKIEIPFRL